MLLELACGVKGSIGAVEIFVELGVTLGGEVGALLERLAIFIASIEVVEIAESSAAFVLLIALAFVRTLYGPSPLSYH